MTEKQIARKYGWLIILSVVCLVMTGLNWIAVFVAHVVE